MRKTTRRKFDSLHASKEAGQARIIMQNFNSNDQCRSCCRQHCKQAIKDLAKCVECLRINSRAI